MPRRTREHRGPGRGHDGTVDTPAAESEPPEDRAIHRAKSPTPAPETFTRAECTPPPPTPSHSATTSPAPTPSIPHDTTNPPRPQQIAAGGSRDTRPPNAMNTPHAPSPEPHNKPEPLTHTPPDVGEAVAGVTQHELERSCHFPIIFFTPHQKFYRLPRRPVFSYIFVSATHFLHVSYFLHFGVPMPCIIVSNSLSPLTLASCICYFLNLVSGYCICAHRVSRHDPPASDYSQGCIPCIQISGC